MFGCSKQHSDNSLKILLTTDVFFHPLSNAATFHKWLLEIIRTAALSAGSDVSVDIIDEVMPSTTLPKAPYQPLQGEELSKAQADLKPLMNSYDLVVGFELSHPTADWLTTCECESIIAFLHPVRYHEDLLFSVSSSQPNAVHAGTRYHIPDAEFEVLASYWKQVVAEKSTPVVLEGSTALVVGQTSKDMSVWDGSRMLSVMDFPERVKELQATHDRVLFKGHPYDGSLTQSVLETFPGIEETTENIYRLLSSGLSHVAAVSSSVVEEARLFGMPSEYLWRPLFNADRSDFSLGKRFLSSSFWHEVVRGEPSTNRDGDGVFISNPDALIRNVRDAHWAYPYLRDLAQNPRGGTKKGVLGKLFS